MENENENTYTVGEFEEMDLKDLYDKQFMIALNSGPRGENKFICNTLCGPFDFYKMCETVGWIYEEQMIHAKVMICFNEFGKPPQVLDENTIDFIEAKYQNIIMDALLGGELFDEKEFTCVARFNPDQPEKKHDVEQDTGT
jgi:hypothetical protein